MGRLTRAQVVAVVVACLAAVVGAAPRTARAELLWSGAALVDPPPTAADATEWSPSLSCASATSCVLVDGAGRAALYDGSGWSPPATIDPGQRLSAVSCASAAFCVAVDGAGGALTYDGSAWSAPLTIDPGGSLSSISCPTTSFCVAVDDRGDAVSWNGTGWSPPTSITASAASWQLGPVSCPTAGSCAVAFTYQDGAECLEPGPAGTSDDGSPGVDGMLVSDGGQWGQPQLLNQVQCQYHEGVEPPLVTGLSCASASFCIAVDSSTAEWKYDGTGWRRISAGAGVVADVVACPSASQCEGFGGNGVEAEDDGAGFRDPQLVWANGAAVRVSCPSTAFCAAVDSAGDVVSGTAVGPLVTLTVTINEAVDDEGGYVTSAGLMPTCQAPESVPCTRAWRPGTAVRLTASAPRKRDRLLGWTGGGCAGAGTCTPILRSNTTVTAVFASSATSDLAQVSDPERDTLRSLRAGGTRRRADLLLPGTLRIVWSARRRVLATARVTAAAPGRRTLRLRLTRRGRSLLTHAPGTLIGWRAVFSPLDGRAATATGSDYLR